MPAAPGTNKPILLFCLSFLFFLPALAQKNSLKGIVTDTAENKKLSYSIVALITLSDTTLFRSVRTTADGAFELNGIPPGKYTLLISYPKMADYLLDIQAKD